MERRAAPRVASLTCLLTLALLLFSTACSSQDGFVLTIRTVPGSASTQVRRYAVQVQERKTRQIVYRSGLQSIDPQTNAPRDLSQSPFRLGLKLTQPGEYFLHVLATDGDALDNQRTQLFFADLVKSDGAVAVDALLLAYTPGAGEGSDDQDNDQFPDALRWPQKLGGAADRYKTHPELLDCADRTTPTLANGLNAAEINPLAARRCVAALTPGGAVNDIGLKAMDVNCSADPPTCIDDDKDGDPAGSDCDDKDPTRFHGNPRPRNCCTCTDPKSCATDHSKLADTSTCTGRCGDSFDYNCTGIIVDCFVDEDCDGYSPFDPVVSNRDCDDKDPRVHPKAAKDCSDSSKDWACDGLPQAGCVPCDLDGDGFQRQDSGPSAACPSKDYKGKIDCNDDDRGVFPGASSFDATTLIRHDLNGQEGGSVAGALRGLCRNLQPDLTTPQDSDCDGDARKGCPPAACDADGDGFPFSNGTMGGMPCNPLGKELDCDDADPQRFPGAPDKCGDGKAQNCRADSACSSDADGDGYNADVDCDDSDKSVHPFAAELCNGKDDDCDGLVDELNPGMDGQRLIQTLTIDNKTVRQTTSCADSTVGLCGQKSKNAAGNQVGFYSGRCVCSVQQPQTGTAMGAPAVACPGAPAKADALGPKCFGAYQPKAQTCDATQDVDDDCDGSTSDLTGKNLAELGNACGVTRGECVAGKVVGCDRSKTNPFFTFAVSGFAAKDKFLVCDVATTRNPKTEICNGKDDDCDGALPGAPQNSMTVLQPGANPKAPDGDEADHDGDKHLACRNCGAGLATGIVGCNDCNDLDNKSYPGASELCDGKDNACTGIYTDGKDDCKGAAEACCAGVPMCVDTSSNFQFCGGCALGCSTKTADACVQSACVCAGQAKCSGGLPVCKAGQGCVQCLATADCSTLLSTPVCKTATNTCVQCVVPADCSAQATNKACNTTTNLCVQCVSAADCAGQATLKACNTAANQCVQCVGDMDCSGQATNKACKVATFSCVQCTNDTHCAGNATKKTCDTAANLCVECTADANCAGNATKKTCDTTNKVCVTCVDNNQCTAPTGVCKTEVPTTNNICVECTVDNDCAGNATKKTCDTTNNVCVACLTGAQCAAPTPACKTVSPSTGNACVECTASADCAGNATKKTCDTTNNICVACLSNANCAAPTPACKTAADPANNVCVECTTSANCAGNPTKKTCDTAANKCVECTADANCSGNATKKTCDTTNKVCVQCLADAQCGGGTPKCKVATNTCVKCIDDGQCANPTPKCDANGTNTCVICLTDADCGAGTGTYCANDKTCKACNTNDHCGATICNTCTGSAEPICDGSLTCTCTDNAQCSTDETCDNATGACYLSCTMDDDCAAAKTSTGKKCGAGIANRCGCVDNNDCPIAGTTCDLGLKTCLCGGTVCKANQACVNSKCQ